MAGEIRRVAWFAGVVVSVLVWAVYVWSIRDAVAVDAHAYYAANLSNLYSSGQEGARDLYVYSPAFAQAIEPLRWIGAETFVLVWRSLEAAALIVMVGPWAAPLLFVQPFAPEINGGNIHLLMGLAIVAGFRYPWTWSLILLTKVTPGVGLMWFAVRREWRSLAIAVGATAAIAGVSFVLNPEAWFDWLAMLRGQAVMSDAFELVQAPLVLRLIASGLLVAWGARTDRRWTVLVAAFIALPVTWVNGLAMFAALPLLLRRGGVPAFAVQRLEAAEVPAESWRDRIEAPGRDRVLPDPSAIQGCRAAGGLDELREHPAGEPRHAR